MIRNSNYNFQFLKTKILVGVLYLFVATLHAQTDFTVSSSEGCTPFNVGFKVTGEIPDSTFWDFGDGNQGNGNATFNIYYTAGTKTVTMKAYKSGVLTTVSKSIVVNGSPKANFAFDKVRGCPPLSVNFKDLSQKGSSNIIKRIWGFDNGIVLEGNDPNVNQIFNSPGKRDISLIIEDEKGCKSNVTFADTIEILPKPDVAFSYINGSSCELPVQVQFTNNSDSLSTNSFQWDFGDGTQSNQISPTHAYTTAGNFNITLTATDLNGCTSQVSLSNLIVDENFNIDISFSDTIGCDSLNITFKPVISSLYKKITWTFDPNLIVDMSNMTIKTKKLGVFPVTLEATSQFGCTLSKTKYLYVGKKPQADFVADKVLSCSIHQQIHFTNLSQDASQYNWSFGDGTNSTIKDPIKVYNKLGSFFVRLNAFGDYGCSDEKFIFNYINIKTPTLELNASNSEGCAPLSTTFSVKCTNGFNISQVVWNFGNGNTYTGMTPPGQVYASAGSYTVKAKVSFIEGCQDITITKVINVGVNQSFSATISSNSICASEILTGSISTIPGAIYKWKIGNLTEIESRTFTYKFSNEGTFPIQATVITNGCSSTKTIQNVEVKPTVANFSITKNCGKRITLTNNSNSAAEFKWNFGDGTPILTNSNKTISHVYADTGTYQIKLSAYNEVTGCTDEQVQQVIVRESIKNTFVLNPIRGCAPLELNITGPDGTNRWTIDGKTLTMKNFNYTLQDSGVYDLSLVNINGSCTDTVKFKRIIEVVKPIAGFSMNPIGGCSPITVDFKDSSQSSLSTIKNYHWKVGNLFTRADKDFTSTFNIEAIIPIQLRVEDDLGCVDSITHDLIVARPIADFKLPSSSFCTGNEFKPENLSTGVGLIYSWDFGDGSPINHDVNPVHVYNQEGTYDITLKVVDANNCDNTKVLQNAVTIQDIAYDFTAFPTTKYCPELLTNFSIIPQEISYKKTVWDFGNGSLIDDTIKNPKFLYLESGHFDVKLYLEDYRGCKDTIVKPQLINIMGPSGQFVVSSSESCAPVDIVLSADVKNSKANFWDFGDGQGFYNTDSISSQTHTYQKAGIYFPSVTVDDGLGCIVKISGPEIKVGGPTAAIQKGMDIVCSNEDAEFNDVSQFDPNIPFLSRKWTFSDGFSTTDSTFKRNILTSDSTLVFLKLEVQDSLGCKSTTEDTLFVFKNAPLEVTPNYVICKGDSVQLSAKRVHAYQWTQSGSLSRTDVSNPWAFPYQNTTYQVRGYVSPTCYTDKTVNVEVKDAFVGMVSPDTLICVGDSAKLTVLHEQINSGKFHYLWTADGQAVDDSQSIIVTPSQSTTYLVKVSNGACRDFNAPVTVEVSQLPNLDVSDSMIVLKGQEVKLEANSDPGVSYIWNPAPDTGCIHCPFAFVRPQQSTTYTVKVINKDGCTVSAEIPVNVIESCDGSLIQIQNVFTPNQDGINDYFSLSNNKTVKLKRLKIFARNGELVFNSPNIGDAWDGTYHGEPVNTGVYVYIIEAECSNGQPILITGNVTLLR